MEFLVTKQRVELLIHGKKLSFYLFDLITNFEPQITAVARLGLVRKRQQW